MCFYSFVDYEQRTKNLGLPKVWLRDLGQLVDDLQTSEAAPYTESTGGA
jgi:hypothetical protein